jgi:tight adherence protein B
MIHVVPRVRQRDFRRRVGQFTGDVSEVLPAEHGGTPLRAGLEAWLSGFRWWPAFEEEVSVAALKQSPVDVIAVGAAGTFITAALFGLMTGSLLAMLAILLIGPPLTRAIVRHRATRQRRLFAEQLPGHLEEIGASMRAGHSVTASITAMAESASEPTRTEFERAIADERLGVSLDRALRPIHRRMKCSDIEQLALVAALQQQTGGDMAGVLELIAATARERLELRREIRALTAQARMSRWVLTGLPIGIVSVLALIQPNYLHPFFYTTGGNIALAIAASLVVAGSLVMRWLVPAEG